MYQVYLRDTIKIIDFATMVLEYFVWGLICVWACVCVGECIVRLVVKPHERGKERRERKIVDENEYKLKKIKELLVVKTNKDTSNEMDLDVRSLVGHCVCMRFVACNNPNESC